MITDIQKIKKSKHHHHEHKSETLEDGNPINFIFKIPENLIQLS